MDLLSRFIEGELTNCHFTSRCNKRWEPSQARLQHFQKQLPVVKPGRIPGESPAVFLLEKRFNEILPEVAGARPLSFFLASE